VCPSFRSPVVTGAGASLCCCPFRRSSSLESHRCGRQHEEPRFPNDPPDGGQSIRGGGSISDRRTSPQHVSKLTSSLLPRNSGEVRRPRRRRGHERQCGAHDPSARYLGTSPSRLAQGRIMNPARPSAESLLETCPYVLPDRLLVELPTLVLASVF